MLRDLEDVPVLVTGAGGFIGSHLVAALLERGAQVHAILRPEAKTKRFQALSLRPKVHHLDVTETEKVRELINNLRPRVVYSLAVNRRNDAPDTLFDVNVAAALSLMDACSHSEFCRFVTIGSSLERAAKLNLGQVTPYAQSRYQAARRLRALAAKRKIAYAHLCTNYVYGPLQAQAKLIPTALQSLKIGTSLPVTLNRSRKDFVHVHDVIRACIAAALSDRPGYITATIATGEMWSVGDVVSLLEELSETSISTHDDPKMSRAWDSEGQEVDLGPALALLGWKPEITLRDGLRDLVSMEVSGHGT